MTKLYQNQVEFLRDHGDAPAAFMHHDMGLGKTMTTIQNAHQLVLDGKLNGLVVVAPKSVYLNWRDELALHWPTLHDATYRLASVDDSSGMTERKKRELRPFFEPVPEHDLDVLLVPITQLRPRKKGRKWNYSLAWKVVRAFLERHRAMLVVDESTAIKGPKSAQTRGVLALADAAEYRRCLSGQAQVNDPLDLYPQYQFLDPRILDCPSDIVFKNRYAVQTEHEHPRAGQKSKSGRKVPRNYKVVRSWTNLDDLRARITPYTSYALKEDYLDLPEKTYVEREVTLTPEQRSAYDEMKAIGIAQWGTTITTAEQKVVVLLRLHQIVCGLLPSNDFDPDGERITERLPSNRIDALVETLQEMRGPALVWAHFLPNIHDLQTRLQELGPTASMYGAVDAESRMTMRTQFQSGDLRYLIGNSAMCRGLTLHNASNAVYFANTYSLDVRAQSEDRIHRIGQSHPCTYVDLVARGTVDETIKRALREKKHLADVVTGVALEDLA